MVGSYIETIDENGKTIKPLMRFPKNHNQIVKFMRWGSCICHPTYPIYSDNILIVDRNNIVIFFFVDCTEHV